MRRRSKRIAATVPLVGAILNVLASIVQNAASATATWPGPLDYLRQYPWHTTGALLVVVIVFLLLPAKDAETPEEDPGEQAKITNNADFSNATINGNVLFNQDGQSPVVPLGQSQPDTSEAEVVTESDAGRLVLLYAISNFLGTGGWEETVLDSVADASSNAVCLPLEPTTPKMQSVSAIIVVVSAAQFGASKRKMVPRLKVVQSDYPNARIILIAADRSEEQFKDQDGQSLVRSAGYLEECTRVLVCPTIDVLRKELASHIRIIVRTGIAQSSLGIAVQDGDGMRGVS